MDNQETLTPLGTQDTERRQRDNQNGQSRDTDTIGYTRHRTKTKVQSRMDNQETRTPFGNTRHRTKTKGQSRMDNQETLTTFGYTRHRTKTHGQRDNQEWTIKRH